MRFHLLGLVHLPVSERYMGCAFTQKIHKLAGMLVDAGHTVFLYGAQGSDAPCSEFIQTHSLQEIADTWGDPHHGFFSLGYDWQSGGFRHDFNQAPTALTQRFRKTCTEQINRRKQPADFLLLTQGLYQQPIAKEVGLWLTCEPGVGYRGSFARFRAFESAYLQNFTYGSENPGRCINGNYYDRVIPNYFRPEHFPFCPDKDSWFLFVGRLVQRKGVYTAVEATAAIGAQLMLAGQQSNEIDVGKLPKHCHFIGYVDAAARARVMGHAAGVFVPTEYLEAFGGVAVEAMLCGTPAITTDFGVFPETVAHGVSGYRCGTLRDFVWAARHVKDLNPAAVRAHAEQYLVGNVWPKYAKWFDELHQLYLSAHLPNVKAWHYLG